MRITSLSEKTKTFDVKFMVCATQKVQPTEAYIQRSSPWINENQRAMALKIIPGVGSDHYPTETQLYILDMERLFGFTDIADFIDQEMKGTGNYKFCTINYMTLCEDQFCQQNLTSSQVQLQNYFINQTHNTHMKTLYNLAPQYLTIDMSSLSGAPLSDIYLKISNNAKDEFPIQKIQFTTCGDEVLTPKNPNIQTIEIDNETNQEQAFLFGEMFENSKPECSIFTATYTHDGKLSNEIVNKMISIDLESLKVSAEGFTNEEKLESIEISLTVATQSGVSTTKKIQINLTFFIPVEEEPEKRAYNSGPQDLEPIEGPFRIELGSTEPVTFTHRIYDLQRDRIDFEWQGIEALEEFAIVTNKLQDSIKKEFMIEVDPTKVEEEGIYEFTLIASDEFGLSAEFTYSIEFYKIQQPIDESEEDEIVEEQEEEIQEDASGLSLSTEAPEVPLLTFEDIQFEQFVPELPIEKKNTRKARKQKKKKKAKPKKPAINIGSVTPQGEFLVDFNQQLVVPKNFERVDYSSVFDVSIQAGLDGSLVSGQFISLSEIDQRRLLSEQPDVKKEPSIKNCDPSEGCAAQSKSFNWYVSYHNSMGMGVKMAFDDSGDISTSSYGQDNLVLNVKEVSFFKSADSNLIMDDSGLPKSDCGNTGATMCRLVPPIIENEAEIESIETTSENMQNSMQAIAFTNLFMAIFFGGMIQQLLGLIKVLQIVLLQACITIVYPGHLTFFYSLIVQLAELDFLHGTAIYEAIFEFKETEAYSPTFEQYEIGDMNFFMNTGSMMVVIFLTTLNFVVWIILYYLSKCLYKHRFCRKIGIISEEQGQLKKPMQKLFVETYIDIIFAASLNFYAINHTIEENDFKEFFGSFDNQLSSLLTITSIFLGYSAPIYIFAVIYRNRERLQSPSVLDQYGVFYEEYNYKSTNKVTPYFTVIALVRRLFIILVLMRVNGQPAIQCMLFTFNSLFAVITLITLQPYEDLLTNRIEIMNELTIYFNSFFTILFMTNTNYNEKELRKAKGSFGYLIIGNICLNMVINMAIISFQSLVLLYETAKGYYAQIQHLKSKKAFEKAEQVLVENIGDEFKDLQAAKEEEIEALDFCKQYAQEREWCFQNDVDFRKLPEETKFQEYIQKFDFEKRRESILKEIELRQKVYIAGLAAERFKITQNVDAKIDFFKNISGKKEKYPSRPLKKKPLKSKTLDPQSQKGKMNHFKQNKMQTQQIELWRSKAVEMIQECSIESGSEQTESIPRESPSETRDNSPSKKAEHKLKHQETSSKISKSYFYSNSEDLEEFSDYHKPKSPKIFKKQINLRRRMLSSLKEDKAIQQQHFNKDLDHAMASLKSILSTHQSDDLKNLPGSLQPPTLDFDTLNELKKFNDENHQSLSGSVQSTQIINAIAVQTESAFQQQLTREDTLNKRIQLLNTKFKANDPELVQTLQDENFDFIKEYDFSKFETKIKEQNFMSQELGRDMPVVCGKRVLLDQLIKVSRQSKLQKISNIKGVEQVKKKKWLQNCKNLGYLRIEYKLEVEESPIDSYDHFKRYLNRLAEYFQSIVNRINDDKEIEVEFIDIEPGSRAKDYKNDLEQLTLQRKEKQKENVKDQKDQTQDLEVQLKSKKATTTSSTVRPSKKQMLEPESEDQLAVKVSVAKYDKQSKAKKTRRKSKHKQNPSEQQ